MNYKEILDNLGFTLQWQEAGGRGSSILQYTNGKILIQVIEKEDGYHEFSACPTRNFDRWANSRHINWRLMVANYTETMCGWKEEDVKADLEKNVNDAIWFCETLPERMFGSINIDL